MTLLKFWTGDWKMEVKIGILFLIIIGIILIAGAISSEISENRGKALCRSKGMVYDKKISTGFWTDDYVCYIVIEDNEIKYYLETIF